MDIYLNLQAFRFTAEAGSFSRAARELGLAPSVVTKRVNQLEHQLNTTLFNRSTRSLVLTESGRKYLDQARSLTTQIETLLKAPNQKDKLEDFIRIKAPTTLTTLYLNDIFQNFVRDHPNVRLEVVLIDRPIDPTSEAFDLAIGAFPPSYSGASDEPLCRLRRVLCASPDYLSTIPLPQHPRDLAQHACLSFIPTGNDWVFDSDQGTVTVKISPRFSSNDGRLLVDAAIKANGIAIVSIYAAREALKSGALIPVLEDFPVPDMWIKAVIPKRRLDSPALRLLMERLHGIFTPVPPWE